MAIFHYTIKIVGRSKGKSVISASAYLNGDVMKNEETGRISYYTFKKEVVYTSLMMCENAPPEWQIVPEENIKRFQKSVRYKRSEDKEAALEKFKITFQKQRLWNEVLKIEKNADAQLGRSFEFALPKEWSRQEQIQYTTDYIQKTFVDRGMCADWSIHDKGDGNPHLLDILDAWSAYNCACRLADHQFSIYQFLFQQPISSCFTELVHKKERISAGKIYYICIFKNRLYR